jgi:ABC-type bacteriocin/lantibiotic exporter with double-glycine peptidase domain
MNIGQFVAAEIIIILIINSVEKLIKSLDSIYDVLTALEKIGYVTDMELDNDSGLKIEEPKQISLSVKNLKFHYPDAEKLIVNNVSFEVPAGLSTVLMGSSGSGKSTLLTVLTGINDPTEGVVSFNNLALNSIDTNSLRAHIGFALSNNQIFYGSLFDNITMGREDATTTEVINAVSLVNLQGFLDSLPDGLHTQLDPEASRIPRSAANKIILARAIVNKPKLLILEDPLDHVPKEEKEDIIQRLTDPKHPWSILITAVDPLWSKYISRHLIMDNGKIISDNLNSIGNA